MWPNSQETVDLVTFTEEILNGKLFFLCNDKKELWEGVKWLRSESQIAYLNYRSIAVKGRRDQDEWKQIFL